MLVAEGTCVFASQGRPPTAQLPGHCSQPAIHVLVLVCWPVPPACLPCLQQHVVRACTRRCPLPSLQTEEGGSTGWRAEARPGEEGKAGGPAVEDDHGDQEEEGAGMQVADFRKLRRHLESKLQRWAWGVHARTAPTAGRRRPPACSASVPSPTPPPPHPHPYALLPTPPHPTTGCPPRHASGRSACTACVPQGHGGARQVAGRPAAGLRGLGRAAQVSGCRREGDGVKARGVHTPRISERRMQYLLGEKLPDTCTIAARRPQRPAFSRPRGQMLPPSQPSTVARARAHDRSFHRRAAGPCCPWRSSRRRPAGGLPARAPTQPPRAATRSYALCSA